MTHNLIMRTTINVPDHLLLEAKKLSAARRIPLTVIFEEGLRLYLAEQRVRKVEPAGWTLPVCDAGRAVRGVNLQDTSELLELLAAARCAGRTSWPRRWPRRP